MKRTFLLTLFLALLFSSSLAQINTSKTDSILATKLLVEELAKESPVDISKLREYLAMGADPRAVDKNNWSLVHEAAYRGDTELLRYCIEQHLELNVAARYPLRLRSPLSYAIENVHEEAEKMLLEHGATLAIPTGFNVVLYDSGDVYIGGSRNDRKCGQGVMFYANGDKYVGEWIADTRSGVGTYYKNDKVLYKGDWKNDKWDGKGKWYSATDSDRYEGDFINGLLEGKGVYYFSNGSRYVGDFLKGSREGKCVFTWVNGEKYESDFKDNYRTGQGTYWFKNGDKYEGGFEKGEFNGYGAVFCAPGNWLSKDLINRSVAFKGNWLKGQRNGYGEYFNRKGKVVTKGQFKDNDLVMKPVIKDDSTSFNIKHLRAVFIEPFALIDLYGLSFRSGLEHQIYKNWSFTITGGLYYNLKGLRSANGYMYKAELKRYVDLSKHNCRSYVSVEYLSKHVYIDMSDSFDAPIGCYLSYRETKNVNAVRFKFGTDFFKVHHMLSDVYFGVGIRYRQATSNLLPYEANHLNYNTDGGFDTPLTYGLTTGIRLDLSLGWRLGLWY